MSRYTPPQTNEPEPTSTISSLAPMRKRRPVVFWMVILGVLAMVLSTVGSFITLLFL